MGTRQAIHALVGAGVVAQAITLGAAPILTRLYSPSALGSFALFLAAVSIAAPVMTGRYEVAVALPRSPQRALRVLVVAIGVAAVIGLSLFIVLAAVAILRGDRLEASGGQGLMGLAVLLPPAAFLIAAGQALTVWHMRFDGARTVARARVLQSAVTVAMQLALATFGGIGLALGTLAGAGALTGSLVSQAPHVPGDPSVAGVAAAKYLRTAAHYSDFPTRGAPQAALNAVSQALPVFLLGGVFGTTVLGWYSLAQRLMQAPVTLVAEATRQSFLPLAGRLASAPRELIRAARELAARLALVVLVPALVVTAFGGPLFALVFGAEWRIAGEYARWLGAWLAMNCINPPAMVVLQVSRRQGMLLLFEGCLLALRTGAIALGAWLRDPMGAVALFAMAGVAGNAALLWLGLRNPPPRAG